MPYQEAVVSALTYTIIRERFPDLVSRGEFPFNQVTQFVLDQKGRMSAFLRIPMAVLTVGFDLIGLFAGGRRFRDSDHTERRRRVEAWRSSRVGLLRDFVRFHEGLIIFGCGSMIRFEPEGASPGGAEVLGVGRKESTRS